MNNNNANLELLAKEIVDNSLIGTDTEREFTSLSDNVDSEDFNKNLVEFKDKYFPHVVLLESKDMTKLYGDGDIYDTPSNFEKALKYVSKKEPNIESKGDEDWYVSDDSSKKYGVWNNDLSMGIIFKSALTETEQSQKTLLELFENISEDDITKLSSKSSIENNNTINKTLLEIKNDSFDGYDMLDDNSKTELDTILEKLIEAGTREFSKTLKVSNLDFNRWKDKVDGLTIEQSSNGLTWRGWNTSSKAPIFVYNIKTEEFSTDEADEQSLPEQK
jgi:hypothetical protein